MSRAKYLPKLIVIVGPTASGKTEAGLAVAKKLKGAVVSADSRQLYAKMNIGTATPLTDGALSKVTHYIMTPDIIEGVPHYLLNIKQPNEEVSLAQWQGWAWQVIDYLTKQGTTPLLVGGTMLYVDSIVRNYNIPAVPKNQQWRDKWSRQSVAQLYRQLLAQDPAASNFIQSQNTRRIIRALEVIKATGKPFSETRKSLPGRYQVQLYGIFPGWDELTRRVRLRTKQMIEAGLEQEKRELIEEYGESLPLLKTINYYQVPDIEAMVRANMRYAKRQMSWWRGRKEIEWFDDAAGLIKKATA